MGKAQDSRTRAALEPSRTVPTEGRGGRGSAHCLRACAKRRRPWLLPLLIVHMKGRLFSPGCSLERAPPGVTGRQQQQPCAGPQPEGSHVSGCQCCTRWPAHTRLLLRHLPASKQGQSVRPSGSNIDPKITEYVCSRRNHQILGLGLYLILSIGCPGLLGAYPNSPGSPLRELR